MDRRNALKAVAAGCIGILSGRAIFTRPAKAGVIDETTSASFENITMSSDSAWWKPPTNVQWDMGSLETVTLVYREKTLVLKTKEIFEALSEG